MAMCFIRFLFCHSLFKNRIKTIFLKSHVGVVLCCVVIVFRIKIFGSFIITTSSELKICFCTSITESNMCIFLPL